MVGITSYGAYVPIYRLSREFIAKEWETPLVPGERSVANYDEDSITMGVEAAVACLNGLERRQVDALYFACTTPPYHGKQCASIVAAAADLREDLFATDFAGSLRGGTIALRAAMDAINSGSAKRALVVASDLRIPAPNSAFEPIFGDGAAAFILGDSEIAVEIEGGYATTSVFMDMWKEEKDAVYWTSEDRFIIEEGYQKHLPQAVSGLMKKYNLTPKDFSKFVLYGPDARRHTAVARALGFDVKTQVQDPMFDRLGNTGCALAPMMLVAALEEAKPGDRILLANYGDGADAYSLRVTEQIENLRDRRGVKHYLASKMTLPSYGKYVRFRDLMEWEVERHAPFYSSLQQVWRDRKQFFNFYGQKCKRCGQIQFPAQRVCMWCQAKDEFEDVRLSDKKSTLFSFSMDERAIMAGELPRVLSVVNIDGGGRITLMTTDRIPEKMEVGMPMEFTFRRIHERLGLHNYFWKVRPAR
jgi:3-hydroxy-3-methylglutaryl CoA synthase